MGGKRVQDVNETVKAPAVIVATPAPLQTAAAASAEPSAPRRRLRGSNRHALSDLICLRHLDRRLCVAADAARTLRQGAEVIVLTIPAAKNGDAKPPAPGIANAEAAPDSSAAEAAPAAAAAVDNYGKQVASALTSAGLVARHDACDRGETPGRRFFTWEAAGVPIRAEVGAREAAARHVTLALHPALSGDAQLLQRLLRCDALRQLLPGCDGAAAAAHGQALRLAPVPVERVAAVCAAICAAVASAAPAAAGGRGGDSSRTLSCAAQAGTGGQLHMQQGREQHKHQQHQPQQLQQLQQGIAGEQQQQPGQQSAGSEEQVLLQWLSQPRATLLPRGYCSKLHLWPGGTPGDTPSDTPGDTPSDTPGDSRHPGDLLHTVDAHHPSDAPCPVHVRHLLRLGPPCYCTVRRHVSMRQLLDEVERQLQRRGQTVERWENAAEPQPPAHVVLFISGLPRDAGVAWLQQQLAAALQPYGLLRGDWGALGWVGIAVQ